jgi:hypothetical protein
LEELSAYIGKEVLEFLLRKNNDFKESGDYQLG